MSPASPAQQSTRRSDQRPAQLQCVLFDFDGTLAETETFGLDLDYEVYRHFGLDVASQDAQRIIGSDGISVVNDLFASYGRPDLTFDDYLATRKDSSFIYRSMDLQLMDGARQLLEDLHRRGITLGVVSTTVAADLLFALERLDLLGLLDVVVAGDMVDGHYKPSPVPYQTALCLARADAARTIVIEDSPTGIAAAQAAGIYTIAIKASELVQDTSAAQEEVSSFTQLQL